MASFKMRSQKSTYSCLLTLIFLSPGSCCFHSFNYSYIYLCLRGRWSNAFTVLLPVIWGIKTKTKTFTHLKHLENYGWGSWLCLWVIRNDYVLYKKNQSLETALLEYWNKALLKSTPQEQWEHWQKFSKSTFSKFEN